MSTSTFGADHEQAIARKEDGTTTSRDTNSE